MGGGRAAVGEHPAQATSWQLAEVQKMLETNDARRMVGDECQYGQETGEGNPVKKPTGWFSNSPEILKKLRKRC